MDARLDLMEFNTRIPQAEKNRDIAYLDKILDDSLMFKRANGSIADKTTYLDSIRNQQNIVESIDQMITSLEFSKSGDVAIVNSIVMFHGVRSGKDVQGIFRNIRYFRNVGGWRMFVWHNDKLSSSLHCLTLHDNGNDFVLNDKNVEQLSGRQSRTTVENIRDQKYASNRTVISPSLRSPVSN